MTTVSEIYEKLKDIDKVIDDIQEMSKSFPNGSFEKKTMNAAMSYLYTYKNVLGNLEVEVRENL